VQHRAWFAVNKTSVKQIQHVSKNVTNLMLNNFSKLEPISVIFCT